MAVNSRDMAAAAPAGTRRPVPGAPALLAGFAVLGVLGVLGICAGLPGGVRIAAAADMSGTMSIVGFDPRTNEIGVAVVSRGVACGNTVPWVQAGVGAIATQGDVNPTWGPRGLAMLREGMAAQVVVDTLMRRDPGFLRRQAGLLDRNGQPGGFTGLELVNWSGGMIDSNLCVQGNSLTHPDAVLRAYESFKAAPEVPLPARLLAALEAGMAFDRETGGARGLRSAALLVGRSSLDRPDYPSRYVYVRVDDADDPMGELARQYRGYAASRLVEAHLHYAEVLRRAGAAGAAVARLDEARAAAIVDSALAWREAPVSVLNAMAWAMAQRDYQLERAREAADRARSLDPKRLDVLDTCAEVAMRQGRWDDARALLQAAAAQSPRDEYIAGRLAGLETRKGAAGAKPAAPKAAPGGGAAKQK